MNNGKPDFSNVSGGASSTEGAATSKPDFSNVQGGVRSTETITGGEGGGGGGGGQTYTVASGDTLSHIAKRFYGKADWKRIYDANRDLLDDPDKIFPGQVLNIPAGD